jgi:hypothetical protein
MGSRFDAGKLGALEQGVEDGGDLGAAYRLAPAKILPPDDGPTYAALGRIVAERYARVVEEDEQAVPLIVQVADGLAQSAAFQSALGAATNWRSRLRRSMRP